VIATGSPAEVRADKRVQQAYLGYSEDADDAEDAAEGDAEQTRYDLPAVPGQGPEYAGQHAHGEHLTAEIPVVKP